LYANSIGLRNERAEGGAFTFPSGRVPAKEAAGIPGGGTKDREGTGQRVKMGTERRRRRGKRIRRIFFKRSYRNITWYKVTIRTGRDHACLRNGK
jgi:hypothetical protein